MKNYLIETTTNGYFVHAGDTPYGGPYKNEESAKRRIRDLKRKDIEAAAIEMAKAEMVSTAPIEQPVVILASIDGFEIRETTPNVEKLAASSEYGKSKFKITKVAEVRAEPTFNMPQVGGTPPTIYRQVGCYPAISKHSYQR